MQDHRLVLYPVDLHADVDMQLVQDVLLDMGVIGEAHEWQGESQYLPGEQFLDRIAFLGCSPFINLAPPEDDAMGSEYCHIAVTATGQVDFLGGKNVRVPRCPHCKTSLDNWQEGVDNLANFACAGCNENLDLSKLNWRRSAAFARCAVHIWGIHDGEAVPSDILLIELEKATGCKWGYFYRQSR